MGDIAKASIPSFLEKLVNDYLSEEPTIDDFWGGPPKPLKALRRPTEALGTTR